MADLTREQVIDYLSTMPVTELSSLIRDLEGKWGVSATPAPAPTSPDAPIVKQIAEAAQTEFDVMITAVAGDKKIATIKVVREVTGLGLKEAKDAIDNVAIKPALIKQSVSHAEANLMRQQLEGAGCTVKLV